LIVLTINAVLAGWFYFINYKIYNNPVYMPGISSIREHSFYTFHFIDLLAAKTNSWHESNSVLTGFFASFFSFGVFSIREFYVRNAVFCLSLLPVILIIIGIISSLSKEKYYKLNIFFSITLLCLMKLLWRYNLSHGILKSCYIMFIVPMLCVYLAEGFRLLKEWSGKVYMAGIAAVIATDIIIIIYYYKC
jgi:hypothetical protein